MKDLVTVRRALKEKYRLQEQTRREIQSLTEAYEVELHGSRGIFVSDHAIVRYLERVKGWTFKSDTDAERLGVYNGYIGKVRDEMLTLEEDRKILRSQLSFYTRGKYAYVIKELSIVTVILN